ncbi:hypothetical protein JEQ12_013681 [Ovis aries]|uniref:Uncharacterized protein n=1 Tax=Ovis aries TaxID=9940 RepID=A0A836D742_SHEEP|nr:hypothetical protein JEQ12_013681 [Ovis aries]
MWAIPGLKFSPQAKLQAMSNIREAVWLQHTGSPAPQPHSAPTSKFPKGCEILFQYPWMPHASARLRKVSCWCFECWICRCFAGSSSEALSVFSPFSQLQEEEVGSDEWFYDPAGPENKEEGSTGVL